MYIEHKNELNSVLSIKFNKLTGRRLYPRWGIRYCGAYYDEINQMYELDKENML